MTLKAGDPIDVWGVHPHLLWAWTRFSPYCNVKVYTNAYGVAPMLVERIDGERVHYRSQSGATTGYMPLKAVLEANPRYA